MKLFSMDPNHASWNRQQHLLQRALSFPEKHPEYISLFLSQHAQVHSARMSFSGKWSFEDEVLDGMDDATLRCIPPNGEHSIAWILWHLARIEDVTMNILVAGGWQLLEREDWLEKMGTTIKDTGNAASVEKVTRLSQTLDLDNLKAYRIAVGQCTRQIVNQLTPNELRQKVDPDRIIQIRVTGSMVADADEVLDYWSKRTIAGLLLMPPTRHCFLHLNEALRIKHSLKI
jgi:hypothetical protein